MNTLKRFEKFLDKARSIHGNKYDYSLANYQKNTINIKIICPIHGEFEQLPVNHLAGNGCRSCSGNKPVTTKEFIERAKEMHGNKYDYSESEYLNCKTKVKIFCKKHGPFYQKPKYHTDGQGCPRCSKFQKLNQETFIKKAQKVHSDKYNYDKTKYKNNRTKILIICKKHGEFDQTPANHLAGRGCPSCAIELNASKKAKNTNTFINEASCAHNNRYDYSLVEYRGAFEKVCIICPKHGKFYQSATSHLSGCGCRSCNNSKGENKIHDFLTKNNIKFKQQKTFKTCTNPKTNYKLYFDFYLIDYNLLIEYDGAQHFKEENCFMGRVEFEGIKYRDNIKNKWCKNNGIDLLRIPYTQFDKVERILKKYLKL